MTKILIVDDDQESRNLLSEVLEASGYASHAVASAMAARETLSRDPEYRIVIADFRMPCESGLELLRKLRGAGLTYEVILMSSYMSAVEKKEAKALGAHALLDKPFQLSELVERVAEVVAQVAATISP